MSFNDKKQNINENSASDFQSRVSPKMMDANSISMNLEDNRVGN